MRHVISVHDLSVEQITDVLDRAEGMLPIARGEAVDDCLRGKVLGSIFFEPSTRTRLSFETAMNRLGGGVIGFAGTEATSVVKGETLADTIRMVSGYADAVVGPLMGLIRLPAIAAVPLAAGLLTGIYLTAFFQYGFEASYESVVRMEENPANRLIRAVHRYASIALVVTSLLHGWRTFFQDRFRGARWVAWTSGVGMMLMLWLTGVTGYWLIWDERTQVLNEVLTNRVSKAATSKGQAPPPDNTNAIYVAAVREAPELLDQLLLVHQRAREESGEKPSVPKPKS